MLIDRLEIALARISEAFELAIDSNIAGGDFNPSPAVPPIYIDSDASGDLSTGDQPYQPGNEPEIAPDASIGVLLVNDIPDTGLVNGDIGLDQNGNRIYIQYINLVWGVFDVNGGLIAGPFATLVAESWRTQFGEWGFGPVHPDWDADKVVEVIFTPPTFALYGGTGTYTASTYSDGSPVPERRIWLQTTHNTFQAYDTLENGLKVVYAHEFFHTWTSSDRAGGKRVDRSAMDALRFVGEDLEISAARGDRGF